MNISSNEGFGAQAKTYTDKCGASMNPLLAGAVVKQQVHVTLAQTAEACTADWNAVHASVGSFADKYCTL